MCLRRGLVLAQVSQFVEGVTEARAMTTTRSHSAHGFGHDLANVGVTTLRRSDRAIDSSSSLQEAELSLAYWTGNVHCQWA